ncbi:MAG: type VII toxin-antitoxin system MntA family adenylyltransferase antitoxin [Sulfobacillus sp.]
MELGNRTITEIVRHLEANLHPQAIYLFGSAARDGLRQDSDVDVGVLTKSALTDTERYVLAGELADICHRDVDVIDLCATTTVLQAQVVTRGRLIAEAFPLDRALFEMRTLKAYAMLSEERLPITERMVREGTLF